ncbi:hypothetical protein E4U09_006556 [Claviceps aff. purpurea]|uniref:Uncharacterized protein n=1 Tax=Claviceps aff. purpurea TaxID=1967640 RepID=A0A9P7QKU7_9HYPO|nr:hypothetical protein E4U09_006556 [Claviceps aff. purpurea]
MESINAAATLQVSYNKLKLSSVDQWDESDDWIEALQKFAQGQNFWYKVDPNKPESPSGFLE